MSMEQKFNEIIREQLPEKVGDELRKVLEDYEEAKKELKTKKTALENSEKWSKRIEAEKADLSARYVATSKELRELKTREKELIDREIKVEVTTLQAKLQAAQRVEDSLTNFMSSVSKNGAYRRSVFSSKDMHVPAVYGENHYMEQCESTKTLTETTTETVEQD